MRNFLKRVRAWAIMHRDAQRGEVGIGQLKGVLFGFIVLAVGIYLTDPVVTAIASVTGITAYESASGIWDLLPMFWVLAIVGLTIGIVVKSLKTN
jgi:hypothetical protein